MAIPDYETLMLPVLEIAGDGQEHRISEVVDQLARAFRLTEERGDDSFYRAASRQRH